MNAPFTARALLLGVVLGLTFQASAAPAACPTAPPLEGTFLQPTRSVLDRHADWGALFADTARLGMRDVYVQWSASNGVYAGGEMTWPDDPEAFARSVLDAAKSHGLHLWLGLAYTDSWWERIDRSRPLESVEVYLRRRLFENADVATRIASAAVDHPAFAGWYVPDEIDDKNWLASDRRAAIVRYVQDLAARLRSLTPKAPVSISGFATGFASPAALAEQWAAIVGENEIDLVLLQDGIGAGHLVQSEFEIVVPPVRAAVEKRGGRFGVVVELFAQTAGGNGSKGPFAAKPAPLRRVREQIAAASRLVTGPLVGFSVPDYMSPSAGPAAADLYRGYLSWERRCGVVE